MSADVAPARRRLAGESGYLSIRAYLMLLIAGILVPMLALVGVLAWTYGSAARRTIEAQRLDVANNLMHLADREIRSIAGFLNGISMSPGLRRTDDRIGERIVEAALARGLHVVGMYDLAGRLEYALPADRRAALAGGEAVGAAAIAAGRPIVVSSLIAGLDPKPGLFFVTVPMIDEGRVTHVLTAGVSPRQLQFLIGELGLRPQWRVGLVDRNGIILARSIEPETHVGTPAQRPMIEAAKGSENQGLFDVTTREGLEVANSFQRSSLTGWTAAAAVPTSVVHAPLWSTAAILAVVGICFTLLAVVIGSLVAGRIAQAVYQLGQAVVAFVNGDTVSLPKNTVGELRDVLSLIEGTSAMGRDRTSMPRQ